MNEWQLMVCLPQMLTNTTTREYRSRSTVDRTDGLECWPEAVKYFLRTYATDSEIRQETEYQEDIRQNET